MRGAASYLSLHARACVLQSLLNKGGREQRLRMDSSVSGSSCRCGPAAGRWLAGYGESGQGCSIAGQEQAQQYVAQIFEVKASCCVRARG